MTSQPGAHRQQMADALLGVADRERLGPAAHPTERRRQRGAEVHRQVRRSHRRNGVADRVCAALQPCNTAAIYPAHPRAGRLSSAGSLSGLPERGPRAASSPERLNNCGLPADIHKDVGRGSLAINANAPDSAAPATERNPLAQPPFRRLVVARGHRAGARGRRRDRDGGRQPRGGSPAVPALSRWWSAGGRWSSPARWSRCGRSIALRAG